ncbi:MAG TPA: hypothetical protein DCO79_02800, partial [Spirochaeta sp.]|nr:hypothetical protein [Spirochaeta sp.]
MIETEESRDGDLTAKINNNYLHSAYSPRKEAVKFYHNNKLEISRTIILLEPCLNYLSEVIRKNNSSAKIISIYCDQYFYTRDNKKSDFSFCFTANNSDLQFFLSKALNELDIESLKIIEWPPAKKFYSERCLTIKQILTQHIRELHGNITTTSGFGQKYFRNFLKNYLYTDYILSPVRSSKAVLIAGSGPGLKADLDFIKDNRNRITLLSLPSSLHFLQYNGIKPDLIISTDPGYYAALHLNGFEDIPVASPLTAAVPFNCLKKGLLAFSQNYFMEACVNNPAPALTLPQHGTVAGSALYLSNILTEGPIFISGFDFSYTDLLSHNRPHTFDNLIESS